MSGHTNISLRNRIAFVIGRVILKLMRLFGRRGTALPGVITERLGRNILSEMIGVRKVICITGTNGKTSTANALRAILRADGKQVIGNEAGSNLMRGIIGSLLAAGMKEVRRADIFVLEVEEATLPRLTEQVIPGVVIVTNLFRDQLDAYGELAHTADLIHQSLIKLPASSTVFLTADDPNVLNLGSDLTARVVTVGLDRRHAHASARLVDAADAIFCPTCEEPLSYESIFYNHLGIFACPRGHCVRPPKPDVTLWRSEGSINIELMLADRHSRISATPPSIPLFMLYNLGTAMAVAHTLGVSESVIAQSIKSLSPSFGRGETFRVGGDGKIAEDGEIGEGGNALTGQIFLTKNPAGTNAVIATLLDAPVGGLWLLLNDGIADGRDVSWIWDVDWEMIAQGSGPIWLGGRRARDLATRLKYAGVDISRLIVTLDLEDAWSKIESWGKSTPKSLAILPTYTALLEVHSFLQAKGLVKGWR